MRRLELDAADVVERTASVSLSPSRVKLPFSLFRTEAVAPSSPSLCTKVPSGLKSQVWTVRPSAPKRRRPAVGLVKGGRRGV